MQGGPAGLLVQPQQQPDRQRRAREGDDDAGDHERLRDRIAAQPGGGAAPRDHAEQQEDAAAEQVEGEDLAQRLGVDDEAVQAEAHQRRAGQAEQRLAHRGGARSGGPATSRPSVAAMESTSATSMTMISGLAQATG